ncbi:hypothetical protein ACDA27_004683 [Salmonella enterica]
MVSVAIKHPSDDVALQFIENSIAINCKLRNNQQKTADFIYHNRTLRALNRQVVSHSGNFGGCGAAWNPYIQTDPYTYTIIANAGKGGMKEE